MKHLERLLIGLLIVLCVSSWVAAGTLAVLALGLCWFVGAALAFVKGVHALITGRLTVIPGWSEFSLAEPEKIHRKTEPIKFWVHVCLVFLLATASTAYGIYAWPVV